MHFCSYFISYLAVHALANKFVAKTVCDGISKWMPFRSVKGALHPVQVPQLCDLWARSYVCDSFGGR